MRQQYHVTIADFRGAHHFSFSHRSRNLAVVALGMLAAVLLLGATGLIVLSHHNRGLHQEMAQMAQAQSALEHERKGLVQTQQALNEDLLARQQQLAVLTEELARIERVMSLDTDEVRPLPVRMETAARTAFERRLMLRSIPSGYPLENDTRITSRYGMRHHPILERDILHGGVDLRAPRGTPVYATADGVVEWAALHSESGLGKMVRLVHNYGFATLYGHLDDIKVTSGTYVKRGELLGHSGSTGRSTAPHLHYEVRYLNRRLDPKSFLSWSMDDYDVLFNQEDRVQWDSLTEIVRTAAHVPERPWLQPILSLSVISP